MYHVIALLAGLSLFQPKLPPTDLNKALNAICQLEGGSWGQLGGKPCIQRNLWKDYANGLPYVYSSQQDRCVTVAVAALAGMRDQVESAGYEFTPAMAYLCWRRGVAYAISNRFHHREHDECEYRMTNLYYDREG